MLRQELQSYLHKVYPGSNIDTPHSIGGKVYIRFELGEGKNNGTIERVNQSMERALTIFNDTFNDRVIEVFVLIYESQEENICKESDDYLHQQFPTESFKTFYNELEVANTRFFTADENGKEVLEKDEVRIIIGKLPVKDINIEKILKGIANNEMGFTPALYQSIFFFDPLADIAFHMYDDRGCFVWSNNADNIREVYIKRNEWIVDYDRAEISKYFNDSSLAGF
jgi:hypothetical protein